MVHQSCCNSFSKIVSPRWKLKTCRSERFYPIRLFLPVSIIIFVSTRKKRAKNRITLFTLQDLNDFSFYIFHFKFIFNYTERAFREGNGNYTMMKRVLGLNGEEAGCSFNSSDDPSPPLVRSDYSTEIIIITREERIFKRIFSQRILSFPRQIDRIGHDDEGDARDTGGPLRPRGQPLLGGRRQSATCCTNIVQGHRAPAARG